MWSQRDLLAIWNAARASTFCTQLWVNGCFLRECSSDFTFCQIFDKHNSRVYWCAAGFCFQFALWFSSKPVWFINYSFSPVFRQLPIVCFGWKCLVLYLRDRQKGMLCIAARPRQVCWPEVCVWCLAGLGTCHHIGSTVVYTLLDQNVGQS